MWEKTRRNRIMIHASLYCSLAAVKLLFKTYEGIRIISVGTFLDGQQKTERHTSLHMSASADKHRTEPTYVPATTKCIQSGNGS